jgi:copper chaperone CopZ
MSNTILNVEGMSCPSCIRHIERALAIRGVASVDVDLARGTVAIQHESSLGAGRLVAALADVGYPAKPVGV